MPYLPQSTAKDFDIASIALFEEQYAQRFSVTLSAEFEVINTIEPPPLSIICLAAALAIIKFQPIFVLYTFINSDMSTSRLFYGDNEMSELIRIENMLLSCDEIDSEIINLLMSGYSYEEIAEKLYCALNTVKYRVRKMKDTCKCDSKRALVDMIKGYCEH